MAFNATAICSKTATATLLVTEQQVNVTPAAATVLTLPSISAVQAAGFYSKTYLIQNVDGAFPVTVTADTAKPDYIVSREKSPDNRGPAMKTFTSVQVCGATDYIIITADPMMGYWFIEEAGLALGTLSGTKSFMPQEFNLTAVGASALNGMDVKFNDMTTISSGYPAAIYIEAKNTGAKTGGWSSTQVQGLAIDVYNAATTNGAVQGIGIYVAEVDNQTNTNASFVGIQIYMEDVAATPANVVGLMISKANATAGSAYDAYIYLAAQGTVVQTGSSMIHFHGARHPQYFFQMSHRATAGFFDEGKTAGTDCYGHLKIAVGDATCYINVFSDNS